jgi:tRNA(fMet)-specific endonuclease VapC
VTLRYLLDTSIVSSPVSKTPNPEIIQRLDEYGDECAIAAPVWHELTYGCRRLPKGQRRAALETYLHEVIREVNPPRFGATMDVITSMFRGREVLTWTRRRLVRPL